MSPMEENPLKPPLREGNLEIISAKVFGDPKAIRSFEPMPKDRKTSTYRCGLQKGGQAVLKYGPGEEWKNQEIATKLNLNAPKIVGQQFSIRKRVKTEKGEESEITEGVWFAMELIPDSKPLNELMNEEGVSTRVKQAFEEATKLLTEIHGSLEPFSKQTKLPHFTKEKVIAEIEGRMQLFNQALEKYDQIREGNPETKRWRSTLENVDKDDLIHIFTTDAEDEKVLVRWDYKPDNLMVQHNGELKVFSIDWRGLHVGARWIDLGFLLSDLPKDKRSHHLETYLKASKVNGDLKEALKNLQTAVAGAQLIHASSNASTVINGTYTEYNLQRLSDHLSQLEQEL